MKTIRTLLKSFLLLTLLMVAGGLSNRAHAQYQSFFGDSITEYDAQVSCISYESDYDPHYLPGCTLDCFIDKSDTITINNHLYIRFCDTYHEFFLREDTTTGRVYRYDTPEGEEYLTCDMSLSVGDTFWMPYEGCGLTDGRTPVPIVADTIMYINGLKHIQFRKIYSYPALRAEDVHHQPILFIEGVGPNYSLFGSLDGWGDDCPGSWFVNGQLSGGVNPFLLCVHKDNELVFMSDERAGCNQDNGALVKDDNENVFSAYPNPTRNILNIEFEKLPVQKGVLYITDMVGRVVYSQETADNHLKISVKRFQSGLYVATWIVGGKKHSVKFVKK